MGIRMSTGLWGCLGAFPRSDPYVSDPSSPISRGQKARGPCGGFASWCQHLFNHSIPDFDEPKAQFRILARVQGSLHFLIWSGFRSSQGTPPEKYQLSVWGDPVSPRGRAPQVPGCDAAAAAGGLSFGEAHRATSLTFQLVTLAFGFVEPNVALAF